MKLFYSLLLTAMLSLIALSASSFAETDYGKPVADLRDLDPGHQYVTLSKSIAKMDVLDYSGSIIGFCTAFLVAPDVVATAAHCVYQDEKYLQRHSPELLRFTFNKYNSTRGATYYQYFGKDFIKDQFVVNDNEGFSTKADWALVLLDRPVKNATPLQLKEGLFEFEAEGVFNHYDRHQGFFIIGHPGGEDLSYKENLSLDHDDQTANTFLLLNKALKGGASGSPVFIFDTENTVKVVGIYTAKIRGHQVLKPEHKGGLAGKIQPARNAIKAYQSQQNEKSENKAHAVLSLLKSLEERIEWKNYQSKEQIKEMLAELIATDKNIVLSILKSRPSFLTVKNDWSILKHLAEKSATIKENLHDIVMAMAEVPEGENSPKLSEELATPILESVQGYLEPETVVQYVNARKITTENDLKHTRPFFEAYMIKNLAKFTESFSNKVTEPH